MKKFIPFFMSFIMIVSMCACSGGGENIAFTHKLSEPFAATAQIQYGDQEAEASFRRYGKANWDVEFSAPNTLSGVILSYRDDKVDASYKGLSFSVPKTALPVKSIISVFIEVADSIAENSEVSAIEKDGFMVIEGEVQQGKYTLKLDKDGGLSEFSMPNLDLKITFSDFHCDSTDMSEPVQPSQQTETVETQSESESAETQISE